MTATAAGSGSADAERFRLLASFLAGRALAVAEAAVGEPPHTDGRCVFVSAGRPASVQRREVLLQAALLGAGSLDRERIRALRGRPQLARRYLALEGRRVLAELAGRLPLAAALRPDGEPATRSADESVAWARGRAAVAEPPAWFGVLRPSALLGAPRSEAGSAPSARDLRLELDPTTLPETPDADAEAPRARSRIAELFANPLASNRLSEFLSRMFGASRAPGEAAAGAGLATRSLRRVDRVGPDARPLPVPLRFASGGPPAAAVGVGGALHPEWDVHEKRYRPAWCRVFDFPLRTPAPVSASAVDRDEVLRRRLTRLGLGPKLVRRQPDGDDLDVEALVDLFVDLRAGHSPPEHVYRERRKLERNLGVLILLDASGSANESDPDGRSVHEHQRRAAATLAATLEDLGDRVALYGFRSHGRGSVHLLALKPFAQRFGAGARARLAGLEPSGYTRLGAAIRHAGRILAAEAGTPNRLLLVLSDGFPYDDGYEGGYAEADARRALEELRGDGVACLCLSIGGSLRGDGLDRVFGSASRASAASLADLSPRMDELFLVALRELAAPQRGDPRRARPRPAGRRA